jgi:hypothetical protein
VGAPRRDRVQLPPGVVNVSVMEITGELLDTIRRHVRDELELLSDVTAQRQYAHDVPDVDVPTELVHGWVEQCYVPQSLAFRQAFRIAELELLADFHRTFVTQRAALGEPLPDLEEFLTHPSWRNVVDAAGRILRKLPKRR